MPIVGFKCPIERIDVGWDHFEHCTACRGRPAFPPWMARMIATKVMSDVRHASSELTATRALGCPRRTLLDIEVPYRVDPMRGVAATRGTALHGVAATNMDDAIWYTEATDPMRLQAHGVLFKGAFEGGVPISAQMDVLKRDLTEIVDWKFPKDWSVKYRRNRAGRASVEQMVQLNFARLLLAQQPWAVEQGYDPENVRMTIWDHAIGDREGPEPMEVDKMDELAILMATPFGEQHTVGDIITEYLTGRETIAEAKREGAPVEQAIATIPLYGEAMMSGAMCTGYCDVAEQCASIVRLYGRPVVR